MKLFFLMESPIVQRYKVSTRVESKGIEPSSYYKEEEVELRLQETVVRGTVVRVYRKEIHKFITPYEIEEGLDVAFEDCLNELELIVSEEGKIISIENYEYLYHRWKSYLINREKNFIQEDEHKYLNEMDNIMNDSVLLLDFLHRDLFLYFFFHIYGYYPYNPVIRNRKIPNFLGYSFFIKEQLEYITTQEGNIEIAIEGNLSNDKDSFNQSQAFFQSKGISTNSIDVELKGKYGILSNNIPCGIEIMLETQPHHQLFYNSIHLSVKKLNV